MANPNGNPNNNQKESYSGPGVASQEDRSDRRFAWMMPRASLNPGAAAANDHHRREGRPPFDAARLLGGGPPPAIPPTQAQRNEEIARILGEVLAMIETSPGGGGSPAESPTVERSTDGSSSHGDDGAGSASEECAGDRPHRRDRTADG